jgi:hypothetical protein
VYLPTSVIAARAITRFRRGASDREMVLRFARDHLRIALGRAEDTVEVKSRLVANVPHAAQRDRRHAARPWQRPRRDRRRIANTPVRVSLETLVYELVDASRPTGGEIGCTLRT